MRLKGRLIAVTLTVILYLGFVVYEVLIRDLSIDWLSTTVFFVFTFFLAVWLGQAYDKAAYYLKLSKEVLKELSDIKYALDESSSVAISDNKGTIIYVNDKFCKTTQYKREEIIGGKWNVLNSNFHSNDFFKELWQTVSMGKVWRGEVRNRKKDGSICWEATTIVPFLDDTGKPYQFAAIRKDITGRKKVEKNLMDNLELAKTVQQNALSAPIHDMEIAIDGLYMPSEHLSGDMYAWYKLDKHRYGIILLDVMGHGVASSLVSMSVRSLLRGIITRLKDPEEVMYELNNQMYNSFKDDNDFVNHYYTAIYLVIDTKNQIVDYVNAGHPTGIVCDNEYSYLELESGGVPVGILPELIIKKASFTYENTLRIFLYTDGLYDVYNESISMCLGHVKEMMADNQEKTNQQFLNDLRSIITNAAEQPDDICFISIFVKAPEVEKRKQNDYQALLHV